jgi:hypothetical protein
MYCIVQFIVLKYRITKILSTVLELLLAERHAEANGRIFTNSRRKCVRPLPNQCTTYLLLCGTCVVHLISGSGIN